MDAPTSASTSAEACFTQPQYRRFWSHYEAGRAWMRQASGSSRDTKGKRLMELRQKLERHREARDYYRRSYNETVERMEHLRQTVLLKALVRERMGVDNVPFTPTDVQFDEEEEVEEEEEITEEMLDFFRQTRDFRVERDRRRAVEEQDNRDREDETGDGETKEDLLLNIDQERWLVGSASAQAPREQPGARRTAELEELYGETDCLTVQGMETELQLRFEKDCDLYQPRLWPNMPLKMN